MLSKVGVLLDQRLVNIAPHEGNGLFLQVPGLRDARLRPLLPDLLGRLLRSRHAPHLVERIHVERKIEEPPLVVGHGGIRVPVELRKTIHEVPYPPVARMEDMRPILVHLYPPHLLGVHIPPDVRPLIDHQAPLPRPGKTMPHHGSGQPGTDNQVVVCHKKELDSVTFYRVVSLKYPPQIGNTILDLVAKSIRTFLTCPAGILTMTAI